MIKITRKRLLLTIILLLFTLVIICFVITAFRIVQYGNADAKTKCDAVIILGAATFDGKVSPVYRERIDHGIWLFENEYVDYLILTGGIGDGNNLSDAAAARQYAIEMGVPEQAVLLEEKSRITEENLKYAKEVMVSHSLHSAIIVSDPLHMKRAMLMASDYGIVAYPSPTPSTMYRSAKTQAPFLAREVFFYTGYLIFRTFR